ncbi:MAG: hypothetical protein A2231_06495 [Candidatus Firestonebacteria bacterium RIFOXYA2_FULL_40_8]|nr:MAG: hypothetical protein A2231_06495 [Candidatus Firestonebacteria bacterium RIFOXYA2_FULL_40_8]
MQYNKPSITFEQQAEQLINRGLVADKFQLIECLKNVSYYRLSGYLYPFKNPDDTFKIGTNLDIVWRHYTFDRRLRLIVLDAIERVEVSVRTQIIDILSQKSGAFGYLEPETFNRMSKVTHEEWLKNIKIETERSKKREKFAGHFFKNYDGDFLPFWMAGEIMSFGSVLMMFDGMDFALQKEVARHYGISHVVLRTWMKSLNFIRNVCAHHSRLWNKELYDRPAIPDHKHNPEWYDPVAINDNRIFVILTISNYFMRIVAPKSKWKTRLIDLLNEYPDVSKTVMGFPLNWKNSDLWK